VVPEAYTPLYHTEPTGPADFGAYLLLSFLDATLTSQDARMASLNFRKPREGCQACAARQSGSLRWRWPQRLPGMLRTAYPAFQIFGANMRRWS